MNRQAIGVALVLVLPLGIAAMGAHAAYLRTARAADQPAIEAVARLLPASDLALAGGGRWLRFPSLEEPGAAFQDGPALPDPDPAGGMMAPPVAVWEAEADRSQAEKR
jgi:hypothetical protein